MLGAAALLQFVALAMGVSVISMAVTMSEIFKPMRMFIGRRNLWFGKLFSCPYCFSHWVSLGTVLLMDYRFPFWSFWPSTVLTTFALIVCSAPFSWVLFRSYADMSLE